MARILSVADAFDARVSDRPYRRGFEGQQAVRVILDEAGSQFDPRVAEAFKKVVRRILEYLHRSRLIDPNLANQTAPFSVSSTRQESGAARPHNGR
jgi:HD-GYP domain-containing protein (c-di-GMP phosphodiesterase class II)